ncbi:MAG: polysaccharide biosynthesis tyrosine autokinase [Candidatus Binatia bacterium]
MSDRKVRWFLAVSLVVLLAVPTLGAWLTPEYAAETILLIDPPRHLSDDKREGRGHSPAVSEYDYYTTQYEILRSRRLASRVIRELGSAQLGLLANARRHQWFPWARGETSLSGAYLPGKNPKEIQAYLNSLEIQPLQGTRLVRIAFRAIDPETAAQVANTHAEEYLRLFVELRDDSLSAGVPGQERKTSELEDEVAKSEGRAEGAAAGPQKRATVAPLPQTANRNKQGAHPDLNVMIVDRAIPPSRSMKSPLISIVVAGLVVLCGGIGLNWCMRRYAVSTLRTPADVTQELQLATLGLIPDFSNADLRSESSKPLPPELARLPGVFSKELLLAYHPLSIVPEAYRSLRAELLLTRPSEPPRSLMFVSGGSGEGKTVTTLNTAIALSQMGGRVLVIDADLRHPHCHTVLRASRGTGLTEFLTGQRELAEVIRATRVERLSFLSGGSIPPNPAELLGSKRMRAALLFLYNLYDYVLIDSPPLGVVSDAIVLSTHADGVILVVDSQNTSSRTAKDACSRLEHARAKLLGVVLNKVDARSGEYAEYCERYRAYYRQSEREKEEESVVVTTGETVDIASDKSSEQKQRIRKVSQKIERPEPRLLPETRAAQKEEEQEEKKNRGLQKKDAQTEKLIEKKPRLSVKKPQPKARQTVELAINGKNGNFFQGNTPSQKRNNQTKEDADGTRAEG